MKTIGFTGTRNGMTHAQEVAVTNAIVEFVRSTKEGVVGLHGDCIGADKDFDESCKWCGVNTTCRPCTFANMRANTGAKELAEPKPPMQRNREIVSDADLMIACPPNKTPIKKGSGTWATIGFTRKAGKPLVIVYPDGEVVRENGA